MSKLKKASGSTLTEEQQARVDRLQKAETDTAISGIYHEASEQQIQEAERMSQVLGKRVLFYNKAATKDGLEQGYYSNSKDAIYVNVQGTDPVAQIITHELTHSIEKAGSYSDLKALVKKRVRQTGGSWEGLRQQKASDYASMFEGMDKAQKNAAIDREIVAEYLSKNLLTDEAAVRRLVEENRTLGQRILDWLNSLLVKFNKKCRERDFVLRARNLYREALQQTQRASRTQSQTQALQEQMQKAYADGDDAAGDAIYELLTEQTGYLEDTLEKGDYLEDAPEETDADESEQYSITGKKEAGSIKEQLRANQEVLNTMPPVASVNGQGEKHTAPGALRKDIVNKLRSTGFKVERKGFGEIVFDEKRLNTSLDYLESEADAIAYQAIPQVLKRGIAIASHTNHKGREYGTVTFAAPVVINGRRGNMAVVVKQTSKNFYKMHRVLTPDGKTLVLSKEENAEFTPGGGVTASGSLATPINSAFANSIKENQPNVNTPDEQFSFSPSENNVYYDVDITEEQTEQAIAEVAAMRPVAELRGNEFSTSGMSLLDEVVRMFEDLGGSVFNRTLGDVVLNKRGVKDDLAHGMSENKAAAFAAIPEVIEQGGVVHYEKNWKGRGYDTATIAAPISIAGEDYLMAVVVHRRNQRNRFYIHDVFTEKEATPFNRGRSERSGLPGGVTSTISIMQKILDVKKNLADGGEKEQYSFTPAEEQQEKPNKWKRPPANLAEAIDWGIRERHGVPVILEEYDKVNLAKDGEVYSYDFLTALPDMEAVMLPEVEALRTDGRIDTAKVIDQGIKNTRSAGWEQDGKLFVKNWYTSRDLRINVNTIRHGLNGSLNRLLTNARLGAVIGDVVRYAVPINALHNKAEGVTGTYAMAGYAVDSQGREFVAIVTVEQKTGSISDIAVYDVIHAVSGRQKKGSQASTKLQSIYSIKATTITIADFLDVVKSTHQSILSEDVLAHYGERRNPNGDYADKVQFSFTPAEGQRQEQEPEVLTLADEAAKRREQMYGKQLRDDGPMELPGQELIDKLPKKAAQALRRIERTLVNKLGRDLSVPFYGKREFLMPIAREIALEYLQTGQISPESRERMFETAYEQGVVEDREFYEEYKEIKKVLSRTKVTLADADKADIPDFQDFKTRANKYKSLWIVDEGGTPVDSFYMELMDMAPELFPADIYHPADQLQRMKDVADSIRVAKKGLDEYIGPAAEEFKAWSKNGFNASVDELVAEMNQVRRYAEDRSKPKYESPQITEEEVAKLWPKLKDTRREYEKAVAKNLLTVADQKQVDRLMRGDITLEHLNPERDNVVGITAVYEAKLPYEKIARQIRAWNKSRKAMLMAKASEITETATAWKDKSKGILYSRETMERNIRDIVQDQELADRIIREYFTPVHKAVADATKLKNKYRAMVKELNLSTKPAKGDMVSCLQGGLGTPRCNCIWQNLHGGRA